MIRFLATFAGITGALLAMISGFALHADKEYSASVFGVWGVALIVSSILAGRAA